MVTKGNLVLASDINAIINKINAEENTRGVGLADLSTVSKGDLIQGQTFKDMITRNAAIAASHCYCQADGSRAGGSGCGAYSYSATAIAGDHDAGDLICAAEINEIEADIDALVAECDCNSYACTCDTNCTCHTNCNCVSHCPAYCNPNWKILECSCYWYCSCNLDCGCHWYCICDLNCQCEYGA